MYSYKLDDINFFDEINGIDSISRTISRGWNGTGIDNVLRKRTESTLTFTGEAYQYLEAKFANICESTNIKIYDSIGNIFIEGTIYAFMCTFNITKGECETQIKDTAWSSLLIDRADINVFIKAVKSYDCTVDITPPSPLALEFFDNVGNIVSPYKKGYNVLDILQFIVNFNTSNQMTVVSNYLTTNKYAIVYGAELGNALGVTRDFSLSFSDVFNNLRKLLNLYIKVDANTIYIEPEIDFFGGITSYSLAELPFNTTKEIDVSRLISAVKLGDNKEPSEDYTSNLPFFNNRWNELQLGNCSCAFDKDNELDLSPTFVINSDVIMDCLANGKFETDFFLIELNGSSNPAQFFQVPFIARWYNDSLRNNNVLANWETYLLNCIANTSENNLLRAVGVPFTNNQSFNLIFDNFVFNRLSCSLFIKYPTVQLDALNAVQQLPQGAVCGSVAQDFTTYTIAINGKYAFRATKIFKWDTKSGTFATVDRTLRIKVYSDFTLTTVLFTASEIQTNVVIPPNGLPNNPFYYPDSMEVTSPIWTLAPGNVVLVEFVYNVVIGAPLSISIVDGFFEYASELLQCENEIPPSQSNYPFKYTFDSPLCNADFESIDDAKEDIISVYGEDCYISEVTQDIKGGANFVLISNTNFTKCTTNGS